MSTRKGFLAISLCLLIVVLCVVGLTACGNGSCAHQWGDWTIIMDAGLQERSCIKCGEIETTPYTPYYDHDHKMDGFIRSKEPTCTEEGWAGGAFCTICDMGKAEALATIPPLGHNAEGIEEHKDATCSEYGIVGGTYCTRCQEGRDEALAVIYPISHNMDGFVEHRDATCVEDGVVGGTYCTRCNHGKDEAEAVSTPALGHNTEGVISPSDATCTKGAVVGGTYCTRCNHGKDEAEAVSTPALGHNTEGVISPSDATCTKGAVAGGTYCTRCNHGKEEAEKIISSALGHEEVEDKAISATLTSTGWTAGLHCSTCGETLIAQVEIPVLGSDIASGQSMVANDEYTDSVGGVTYRYIYSINIADDYSFSLTTTTIGSDKSYTTDYSHGIFFHIGNKIHELRFDDDRSYMYVKAVDDKFELCKKDGSAWDKAKYNGSDDGIPTEMATRKGNSPYGYDNFANSANGEALQALYRRLFYVSEAFVNNTDDVIGIDGAYVLDLIELNKYSLNIDEIVSVWKVFIVENPRYYWLSQSLNIEEGYLKFCIDEAYAKADYRAQCDRTIEGMIEDFDDLVIENASELEIAVLAHDFIINRMNYAYESDGVTPQDDVWAHNLVGCAKYNLGVCESYAETFMLLCRLYDVNAIIVSGTGGGEVHAWNMVSIDGAWYVVDATWDETNQEGKIAYSCFGMTKTRYEESHVADSDEATGIDYLYPLPTMSDGNFELVDLIKNGERIGIYESIDEAFEHIIDQNADYIVQLYQYTLRGLSLIASADVEHDISGVEIPNAKSVTIKGHYIQVSGDMATCTKVIINNELTLLAKTLILTNVNPTGEGSLDIQDNCLVVTGEFSYLQVPIIGNIEKGATSKIVCDTTGSGVEFYYEVKVYEMLVPSNALIRNEARIVNLKAKIITVFGGNAEIENLYGNYEYCNVGLEEVGKASIKNLYAETNAIRVMLQFGKMEDLPELTLGNVECNVDITLFGTTGTIITDMMGNVVGSVTESIELFSVTDPIFHLTRSADFDKISIHYANKGDKTDLYCVDENGDVGLKTYENIDGLIVIDNVVVHYDGSATIVTIPEGITVIGKYAFYDHKTLVKIVLPQTLLRIEENAFAGCDGLIEIINKSNLNLIAGSWENGHVAACAKHIINDATQSFVEQVGDYIFYNDGETVLLMKYLGTETTVTLPEYKGLTYGIATGAFEGNDKVTIVTISKCVTSIAMNAFSTCGALKEVYIPNSVLAIERQAFGGCEGLTIYCEAMTKPSDWDDDWHFFVAIGPDATDIYYEVIWGYDLPTA